MRLRSKTLRVKIKENLFRKRVLQWIFVSQWDAFLVRSVNKRSIHLRGNHIISTKHRRRPCLRLLRVELIAELSCKILQLTSLGTATLRWQAASAFGCCQGHANFLLNTMFMVQSFIPIEGLRAVIIMAFSYESRNLKLARNAFLVYASLSEG